MTIKTLVLATLVLVGACVVGHNGAAIAANGHGTHLIGDGGGYRQALIGRIRC